MDREKHGQLIRTHRELNKFIELCFRNLNIEKQFRKYLLRVDLPFGLLLAEVFRNTAEHAYLRVDGGRCSPNMRCVKIAKTLGSRERLSEMTTSAPQSRESAKAYFSCAAQRKSSSDGAKVPFLEFSIFDSGPGFAATISKNDLLEIADERAAVARCFEKHRSAKPSPASGLGLHKMLGVVHDLGGFMRLRTSSVEAFYAAHDGFNPEMDAQNFVHGGLARVAGSLVTVGIPITYCYGLLFLSHDHGHCPSTRDCRCAL
jgi:hypothetical protein